MTRSPMFLKYMFCKISYLCILGQKCNSPQSFYYLLFSWIFKICISFLKRFMLELLIMLYVTFLTSD